MARALEIAGLPLESTHHRGFDDARNIARSAILVLPRLEAERTRLASVQWPFSAECQNGLCGVNWQRPKLNHALDAGHDLAS